MRGNGSGCSYSMSHLVDSFSKSRLGPKFILIYGTSRIGCFRRGKIGINRCVLSISRS